MSWSGICLTGTSPALPSDINAHNIPKLMPRSPSLEGGDMSSIIFFASARLLSTARGSFGLPWRGVDERERDEWEGEEEADGGVWEGVDVDHAA